MDEQKKASNGNIVWRKIKRFFRRLYKRIIIFFKKSKMRFMKIKKEVRYIIYIWVIVFLVFVLFLIGAKVNNKFLAKYKDMENAMDKAVLDYSQSNLIYPSKSKPDKLSIDFLIDEGYLYKEDLADESCTGYALVYYEDDKHDFNVKSYISCKKYTTEGYEK